MRKICVLLTISIFLLMVASSFAQIPRANRDVRDLANQEWIPSEGLTMFTNIGTTGVDVDGVPSYIQMIS
jgi:hypothetical protein